MEDDVLCEWKVRSCSSEGDVHTASNVLTGELFRVWQTQRPSDEAWLVLEAHPPSAFSELEIVNAGSSLVEVFGLPEESPHEDEDDYLMLLSAQQMMSTKDVINKANRNRSFTYTCTDKLSRLASQHRWKQIKILCRQPFGSEEQKMSIGLSRICLKTCKTSAELAVDAAEARLQQNMKASLSKMFPKGSFNDHEVFSKVTEPSRPLPTQKVEKENKILSPVRGGRKLPSWESPSKHGKNGAEGNTSCKIVSSEEAEESATASQKKRDTSKIERPERKEAGTPSDMRIERTLSNNQEKEVMKGLEASRSGPNKHVEGSPSTSGRRSEPRDIESSSTAGVHQASHSKQSTMSIQVLDEPGTSRKRKEPPSSKRVEKKEEMKSKSPASGGNKRSGQNTPGVEEPKQANAVTVPFSKFLDGVIFAISGLVNPERAEVRDKALQMGGQYRPDWMADCTLLICAFGNTPKFNQVKKDNGTIVSKEWIQKCYEQKKLIDIEKYLMHVGKPWRQISTSMVDEPYDECPSPSHTEQPTTTLASLQEIEGWAREDIASSITWLKQQEVQPDADKLQSVAIQGIKLCLDDSIECLRKKQSVTTIMQSWDYVPRAVQELAAREDKAGKRRNFWSDMLSEAERLKWIYAKVLGNLTGGQNQHTKQASMDGEDDDTEDAATDVMPDDDELSDDTQVLDEDDIQEAKEIISKMFSSVV